MNLYRSTWGYVRVTILPGSICPSVPNQKSPSLRLSNQFYLTLWISVFETVWVHLTRCNSLGLCDQGYIDHVYLEVQLYSFDRVTTPVWLSRISEHMNPSEGPVPRVSEQVDLSVSHCSR